MHLSFQLCGKHEKEDLSPSWLGMNARLYLKNIFKKTQKGLEA
jgi:hypothetical protein